MARKTVVSPKTTVNSTTTVNFGEREILMDILNTTKSLALLYGTMVQEASNNDLLKKVKSLSTEISNEQRNLFNFIYAKGWYVLEAEDRTKINKAARKFSNQKRELTW